MFKCMVSLVAGTPIVLLNVTALLALWGIQNALLALALTAWIVLGAFADLRRVFLALGPK
jgi:hypothetical protein